MLQAFQARYTRECNRTNVIPADTVIRTLEAQISSASTSSRQGVAGSSRKLDLNAKPIALVQLNCVMRALASDGYFLDVDLGDTQLGDNGVLTLASALERNTTLKTLNLSCNNIQEAGCIALHGLLKRNTPLIKLDLSWNALGVLDQGVGNIAEALSINDHLENLCFQNCQLGHASARAVSNCLMSNSTLKVLDMRWNNVGLLGAKSLLQALEFNTTLLHLKLDGNHIPETVLQAIEARTSANRSGAAARSAEKVRAELMQREIQDLNQRSQQQFSLFQRENEALKIDSTNSKEFASVLQDTLEDRTSKVSTLETRLDLCTRELDCRQKEMSEMSDEQIRLREELVARKHKWQMFESTATTEKENLEQSLQVVKEEFQKSKHASQLKEQHQTGELELLRLDLHRAKEEIANVRRESESFSVSSEERFRNEKSLFSERISSERERSQIELVALQNQLKIAQNHLEQSKIENKSAIVEVERAMKEATQNSVKDLRSEHSKHLRQWEQRATEWEAERSQLLLFNNNQKEHIKSIETKNEHNLRDLEQLRSSLCDKEKTWQRERAKLEGELSATHTKIDNVTTKMETLLTNASDSAVQISSLETVLQLERKTHGSDVRRLEDELANKTQKIVRLVKTTEAQAEATLVMREADVKRVEGLESALRVCVASAAAN